MRSDERKKEYCRGGGCIGWVRLSWVWCSCEDKSWGGGLIEGGLGW